MENINFLPISIKEKNFRRREQIFIVIIAILTILSLIIIIKVINIKSKIKTTTANIRYDSKPRENKIDIVNDAKEIEFIVNNARVLSGYEAINMSNGKIIIKYSIENEENFVEKIKEIENIKEATIDYLVAPYKDINGYMFEIGLGVSKWKINY